VHALLCNTSLLWYVFPAALSVAATTLIGNSLGARDAKNARQYAIIAFGVVVVYSVINGALSLFYRSVWFRMWYE
jgi:Na+-driven multidrug efflux pump